MLDKSIDGALLALRKQIIRGDLDGLKHVEALLAMRGVELPRVMPAKRKDVARSGHMSRWVIEALRDGPCRFQGVVAYIAVRRPELDRAAVCQRTGQTLDRLKHKGWVVQDFGPEGCLWKLAP